MRSLISKRSSKKGQIQSIIFFAAMVLMLVIVAPLLMKMTTTVVSKFGTAIASNPSTNISAATSAITKVQTSFTNTFDWVLMFFFIFNVILLLITAFLVDVHPAFLVVYIVALVFLFIFAPTIMDAAGDIWDYMDAVAPTSPSLESTMPMMAFIKDHYTTVVFGLAILSGIIMYGKYRLMGGGTNAGNYY